jgi:hypothetical protein
MPEPRTTTKLIRFRPEELAQVTARARACGQAPARFIRETALGAIPRAHHDLAAAPLLHELARIGRSLDELARVAKDTQDSRLAEQVQRSLEGHRALLRHLLRDRRRKGGTS